MHDIIPIIAITFGCSVPILIVGIVAYFRSRDRSELQKTVRAAIEKGETLPAEFMESLQRAVPKAKTPMNDVRAGLILIAIAGGIMIWHYIDHDELGGDLSGIAAIPGLIGVALLILGIIGMNTRSK
jgi:hypothetical protein